MSTPSDRLRAKIGLVLPAFGATTQRLWSRSDLATVYPDYLVLMHQMVRATVPLMDAAIGAVGRDHADDAVAVGLARYLRRHRGEEEGHDRWVAEDLASIVDDAAVRLAPAPGPDVASCVGSQYYWIQHHHPVALLGHIAVLEGHPPHQELASTLEHRSGLPATAFRTLRMHALIDRGHAREVFATIDSLGLRPEHEHLLGMSAFHTLSTVTSAFERLLDHPPRLSGVGATR